MSLTTYLTYPEIKSLYNSTIFDREIDEVNQVVSSPFLVEGRKGLSPLKYTLYNAINFSSIEDLRIAISKGQPGVDELIFIK